MWKPKSRKPLQFKDFLLELRAARGQFLASYLLSYLQISKNFQSNFIFAAVVE